MLAVVSDENVVCELSPPTQTGSRPAANHQPCFDCLSSVLRLQHHHFPFFCGRFPSLHDSPKLATRPALQGCHPSIALLRYCTSCILRSAFCILHLDMESNPPTNGNRAGVVDCLSMPPGLPSEVPRSISMHVPARPRRRSLTMSFTCFRLTGRRIQTALVSTLASRPAG